MGLVVYIGILVYWYIGCILVVYWLYIGYIVIYCYIYMVILLYWLYCILVVYIGCVLIII